MAGTRTELQMIKMSEIQSQEVAWLWFPFIPYGKLTIVQGEDVYKRQGCACVEMECDAIAAQFRNRSISRSFYSSDNLENMTDIGNPLTFAPGLRYNGQVKEQC